MEVRKNQVYGCYVVEDKEENTATENFKTSSDNINLASNDAIVPENNTFFCRTIETLSLKVSIS